MQLSAETQIQSFTLSKLSTTHKEQIRYSSGNILMQEFNAMIP